MARELREDLARWQVGGWVGVGGLVGWSIRLGLLGDLGWVRPMVCWSVRGWVGCSCYTISHRPSKSSTHTHPTHTHTYV